jgi:diguanylate cyclase (GGDEF)-like protein
MSDRRTALLELIDKIEHLGQFQDRIDSPNDIHQIWNVFLANVQNLIEIDAAALFLVDEQTREFDLLVASPEDQAVNYRKEVEYQIECGIFSWIINRRQPALIPAFVFDKAKSIVMLPLTTVKRTLGVALVVTPVQESVITHESLKLMTVLTKQCSLVMENTLLYERLRKKHESLVRANGEIRLLSITDALTGSYNRAYLNEHLPHEIKRALRYNHALAVSLCDIDHFKIVNDTHGHLCGDFVLKGFVQNLKKVIRSDADWMARYGGEEFLLVLPETNLKNAHRLAERLRQHICRKEIQVEGKKIRVTASFGVAALDQAHPMCQITADLLINAADRYLYQAKNRGRNQVVSGTVFGLD